MYMFLVVIVKYNTPVCQHLLNDEVYASLQMFIIYSMLHAYVGQPTESYMGTYICFKKVNDHTHWL